MISPEKCPYCFRQLGTWVKDPIFLPNGGPYVWTSDTEIIKEDRIDHRFYKGFYQICEPEVQEIQDFLKQTEIDNSITPLTDWSPLTLDMKFQITGKHIKEMRDSVEKLLTNFGLTKTDYFNYDEEGNEITQPNGQKLEWTDPITNSVDLKKFQVKYIHIEDLRHYIQQIYFRENFETSPIGFYGDIPLSNSFIGQDSKNWSITWSYYNPTTFYAEITSVKDVHLYMQNPLNFSATVSLQYFDNLKKYKIKTNYKLYFDINLMSIVSPNAYDVFVVSVHARSVSGPNQEYILAYSFNYNPITYYAINPPNPPIPVNIILGGNIISGSYIKNFWSDMLLKHPDFIKWYDGTYSTDGFYIENFYIQLSSGATSAVRETTIDNIKLKL